SVGRSGPPWALQCPSSAQIHATVDVNDLPGEVGLLGLRKKQRRGGNFIHVTPARHWQGAVPWGRGAGRSGPHRLDGSGRDNVGGDATVAILDGKRSREPGEAGFGRQIVGATLGARVPGNATERDDASPTLGDHARQGCLRTVKGAVERDIDDAAPGRVVEIEKIELPA